RADLFHESQVSAVHGQLQVEVLEIPRRHLARAQSRNVVAARIRVRYRATVRRLAGMEVVRSRRIGSNLVLQAVFQQELPENSLRGGRTADVSGADKKNR